MTYRELWQTLTPEYGAREARSIARLVYERRFGLSLTDICMGKDSELSENERIETEEITQRLLSGEPVQYVLGCETFRGKDFAVRPGVLIPRPETEQIVDLMLERLGTAGGRPAVLDIGTGSGCIAVSAALEMAGAKVEAWDISREALSTAAENARRLGARVEFRLQDALAPPADSDKWDIVVSNPPYICERERSTMERHVTEHEPHGALFVPDAEPLLFYRAISRYAARALRRGGLLLFETNHLYAAETAAMMEAEGLDEAEVVSDRYGRRRFATAKRP